MKTEKLIYVSPEVETTQIQLEPQSIICASIENPGDSGDE